MPGEILNICMCELMQFMHRRCLCAVLQLCTFAFKSRLLLCTYLGLRCGNSVMKRYRSPIVTGVQIRRLSFSKEVPIAQRYNTRQFVLQPNNVDCYIDMAFTGDERIKRVDLFIH